MFLRSSRFLAWVSPLPPASKSVERLLALLDLLGEADLVVLREQRVLPDIGQIQANQVFFVPFDALFRQENRSPKSTHCGQVNNVGRSGECSRPPGVRSLYDTGPVKDGFPQGPVEEKIDRAGGPA